VSEIQKYIYSHNDNSSLRGGTEQIELLLIENRNFKKISFTELRKKKGNILTIGVGLFETLSVLVRSRRKITVLKTATYYRKRLLLENIIYFVLYPFVQVVVISKWQVPYYYNSNFLNLYDLYSQGLSSPSDNIRTNRKYRFAYIGRIDQDKGYFEAKKILLELSKNNKCLMDLLLWDDSDLQHLPLPDLKSLDLIIGGRDKKPPNFHEIQALILPYQSLASTVAIPLVLLEGCLAGCVVYTTAEIVKQMHDEFPALKPHIKVIGELTNG
jgi:glycosyltransferase involved in cell wall biosynthesis